MVESRVDTTAKDLSLRWGLSVMQRNLKETRGKKETYRKLHAAKTAFDLYGDMVEHQFRDEEVTRAGKRQVMDKEPPVLDVWLIQAS